MGSWKKSRHESVKIRGEWRTGPVTGEGADAFTRLACLEGGDLLSLPARVATLIVAFLAVAAVVAFVVVKYFLATSGPPVEDFTAHVTPDTGAAVNVVMQEAPQTTVTTDPDWVTYFIQSPQTHNWVHTTNFAVPAGSRVNVTVFGFDGCTPLRNQVWGQVTGTVGNSMTVNGKTTSLLNSWSECSVAHTFAIPNLGLNVPVASPTTFEENSNLCSTSPCSMNNPHTVVRFSFMTPRTAGTYFWQCKIPCGLGYLDGNGGPMQTLGYMTGNMQVVG